MHYHLVQAIRGHKEQSPLRCAGKRGIVPSLPVGEGEQLISEGLVHSIAVIADPQEPADVLCHVPSSSCNGTGQDRLGVGVSE